MKEPLVRFGLALEQSLLRDLDALVRERGGTRSELLRDLARAEVGRAKVREAVDAVAALTLVYDHRKRGLSERLTEIQDKLGEQVRSMLHVHINRDLRLQVLVMRGRADRLQYIAGRLLALRGVKQGGIEFVITGAGESGESQAPLRAGEVEQPTTSARARGSIGAKPRKLAAHEPPARRHHHRGHTDSE